MQPVSNTQIGPAIGRAALMKLNAQEIYSLAPSTNVHRKDVLRNSLKAAVPVLHLLPYSYQNHQP